MQAKLYGEDEQGLENLACDQGWQTWQLKRDKDYSPPTGKSYLHWRQEWTYKQVIISPGKICLNGYFYATNI